jgi:integrase/recombinase XerD
MRFQEHQLNEYRRHAPDCKLKKPSELNCNCPMWAQGRIRGKLVRRSLNTRSRQRAREIIKTLLDDRGDAAPADPARDSPKISVAIADYLRYCEHNKRLKGSTLTSYRDTLSAFEEFATGRLFRTVDQMNLRLFEEFQATREVTPKTMAKEFQHLTSFCTRQIELNWLATNFAKNVALPKADGVSTLPFNEAEAKAILASCARLGRAESGRGGYASYSAEQIDEERRYAKALVLVLLTTGLRISDTVNLGRHAIFTDRKGAIRLRIRTEKTGVVVTLLLPNATVQALKNVPVISDTVFFWKGGDERQFATACDRARRVIGRLGAIAGVQDARPHRFRDTWAKTALLNGTAMRTVQLVLGHKSIRTTEQHYAPFVPEYQQMIDAATNAVAAQLIA